MKFMLDQDVYAITARFLRDFDHDIVTADDLRASRAADEELLAIAHEHTRLFMTRDRDFGSLVFVRELGAGIIYLRMLPSTINAVHVELARVLQSYSEEELHKAFVVVEPGRHRFRRISH